MGGESFFLLILKNLRILKDFEDSEYFKKYRARAPIPSFQKSRCLEFLWSVMMVLVTFGYSFFWNLNLFGAYSFHQYNI